MKIDDFSSFLGFLNKCSESPKIIRKFSCLFRISSNLPFLGKMLKITQNMQKSIKSKKNMIFLIFLIFHEFCVFSEIPEKCSQTKSQRIRQKIKIYEKRNKIDIFHVFSSFSVSLSSFDFQRFVGRYPRYLEKLNSRKFLPKINLNFISFH